jgi:fatty acid desaturase
MGKGSWNDADLATLQTYTWQQISTHTQRDDRWIVIDGFIYDVTSWAKKHPGGEKIISGHAGHDASDAWYAFHTNKVYSSKFLKPLLVGRVRDDSTDLQTATPTKKTSTLLAEFHEIRAKAERDGLFRPSPVFYTLIMLHIFLFEFLGWMTMRTFGTGWISYIAAACLLTTAQIQAGWSQHDYGHLSVFRSTRLNHYVQIFVLNFIKGASCDWWNFRHNNHHSKPNILTKDPDITLAPLFVVGNTVATEYGRKKKKYLPYASQHKYFFFVLPPLLLPLYFNFEIPYFLIKRRRWTELVWMSLFFVRWQFLFSPMLGVGGVFLLFLFVRLLESHWFVWATQMSHLPMTVDYDNNEDWVTSQVQASCNIEQSAFNDWWSGHLNFQIEHHLFPSMPRHNLAKVAPVVEAFCKKHHLDYQRKPLLTAFGDIIRSLKMSGQTWLDAYNM